MDQQDNKAQSSNQNQGAQQEADDEEIMIPITTLTKISNYVDRYFVRFYKVYTNESKQCLNQYAFQHTNKLCLIGLAPEHDIIANKKTITKVSYDKVYSGDMQKLVKGKKKKGGIKSTPDKTIGEIFCDDGSVYQVKGVIDGNIIELNDNLFTNPQWITEYPDSKGYLGIINIGKKAKLQNRNVLNKEQYQQVLSGVDIEVVKAQSKLEKQDEMEEEEDENDNQVDQD
ncbi:glycine cleavage H-protein (macronuclear) [Tetrahymena thermophila SB210]|uniref:Protein Abitram n=1 Tax=Tetrahymena thermophila (strain SB210) TaxID=312017 RepID=W7XFP4_TETTS|nr:glycine cleavage H-protein [Tetrahymena thermophila SB210]EWS75673.1 glycine cleavage H-protein [Tetrahymena thermophila SB210]|eukprot:XP_012651819.1 glycine cleavage H-protein [Tetrahymena thermophila SB210]